MSDPLDHIRAVDSQGQLDDVLGLPDQLGDALWRVETASIEPFDAAGLVICGMGGSGIGGDLAAAALGDRLSRPIKVVRNYELPPSTPDGQAALCVSYSGETEETLACFEAADALGMRRIVATTGGSLGDAARAAGVPVVGIPSGLQPRAAVGYMFAIAAEITAASGVAEAIRTEIDTAAAWLSDQTDALVSRSAEIAAALGDSVPAFYGCDLTGPVAYRWKTQVNENVKHPAIAHRLPEIDHNEVAGWTGAADAGSFSAVFLEDGDQHPRERERAEITAKLIEPHASAVLRVETEGTTRTARLLWAVMLGDLVSLHLAAARGVDPTPIEAIDRLKAELKRG